MSSALTIAYHTWREHVRNKTFGLSVVFSIILLYVSVLLGSLAVDEELRVLTDFGLGFIELMCSAIAIYGASTGILQEMDTKTIYLILSRPISRLSYLCGRYLGLLFSTYSAMLLMTAAHVLVLALKGWHWHAAYPLAIAGIALKLAIAAALASFWALASTSVLTTLTITVILWTLGHFIPEIKFLLTRTTNQVAAVPLNILSYLLPNLQLLNLRDRLDVAPDLLREPVALALGYTAAYCASALTLAYGFFSAKEF